MANIVRKWKRVVYVGCNHGHLGNQRVIKNFFKFVDNFDPDTRVHLGDVIDTAAFRSGAAGSKDEGVSLSQDLDIGLNFIREFKPTHLRVGNHDHRMYKNADHHNATTARAACSMIRDFEAVLEELGTDYTTDYHIRKMGSYLQLGDTLSLHGFFFGENANRDHAERLRLDGIRTFVHAHTHTQAVSQGRTLSETTCYSTGSLADFEALDYAGSRAATLRWNAGCVAGEYCDNESRLWAVPADRNQMFHLPR